MATISGDRLHGGATTWRVPRSRGATSGFLVLVLGAWGALVPFIGPHFGYAFTPNATWTMTAGRLWLEVVPGAVAALAGLVLMGSASRMAGMWAGWLAALAGAWFAVGPIVSMLWTADGRPQTGAPVATTTLQTVIEQIGFFTGLGVVVVFLAATAIGRFSVVGVKEATMAADTAAGTMPVAGDQDTQLMEPDSRRARRAARRQARRDAKAEARAEAAAEPDARNNTD